MALLKNGILTWRISRQVNIFDSIHALLFVYLASRNPTWSPTIFQWTPIIFVAGLSLHVLADHSKYLFRKDAKSKGKVYTGGVWGVVRHPNFLGFTIWRTAFATAAGGWGFGCWLCPCLLIFCAALPFAFSRTTWIERMGGSGRRRRRR